MRTFLYIWYFNIEDIIDHSIVYILNTMEISWRSSASPQTSNLEKKEIVVLNKTDLIDKDIQDEIINEFSKNVDCEILTLSTLDKNSISQLKSKLINMIT